MPRAGGIRATAPLSTGPKRDAAFGQVFRLTPRLSAFPEHNIQWHTKENRREGVYGGGSAPALDGIPYQVPGAVHRADAEARRAVA